MDVGLELNLVLDSVPLEKKSNSAYIRQVSLDIKKKSWKERRMAAMKIVHSENLKSKNPQTAFMAADNQSESSTTPRELATQPPQSTPSGLPNSSQPTSKRSYSAPVIDNHLYKKPKNMPQKEISSQGFISSLFSSGPEGQETQESESVLQSTKPASSKPLGFAARKAKEEAEKEADRKAAEPIEAAPLFVKNETFTGIGIDPLLSLHLSKKFEFEKPTLIQKASIPVLLDPTHNDAIIQAQTGSGKTLAFLLPILHSLIRSAARQSTHPTTQHMFSRTAGTFAIILAPTRELAHQISEVLDSLLKYSLQSAHSAEVAEASSITNASTTLFKKQQQVHYRHWIVSSIVVGGEKRKSEKARLRKGVNILVCTPGRLLDHLRTTDSFDVSNLRWLILDEADNLLHLGFEETLRDILKILDTKRDVGLYNQTRVHVPGWPRGRQTVLCSATIEAGVKRLAEYALVKPNFIRVGDGKVSVSKEIFVNEESAANTKAADSIIKPVVIAEKENKPAVIPGNNSKSDSTFDASTAAVADTNDAATIPKQLKQSYVLTPPKLRLVTLIALLRKITSTPNASKVVVFMATGDSVDFHFDSFIHALDSNDTGAGIDLDAEDEDDKTTYDAVKLKAGVQPTNLFPNVRLFKLHGSMPHAHRQATYTGFCAQSNEDKSILLCTDVAARGLDLPDVAHIVQYDPPGEVRDYIHRIGRTARLGRQGAATLFLMPSELLYLETLKSAGCDLVPTNNLLEFLPQCKFGGVLESYTTHANGKPKRKTFEVAATDLHMAFERHIMASPSSNKAAQKAYTSQIRAYATHTVAERHIFHIKNLHLGHWAKSFALREAPTGVVSRLGQEALGKEKKRSKEDQPVSASLMKRRAVQMASRALTSEFADGDVVKLMRKRK
ncbi:hypothetical protein BDV3_000728 [Batrachochytrium dendrobatidis]|uniref:ATP-dependent RNA helicase n=1 Tax=Batrachochytrium dendrobatidis (strain JEL423) TaxID=403673 RepID=A0A177W7K6_BATDL|nr:hypothetical protein BDEG_20290 [Batrachochytrium dendrobatidis JEL423]